MKPSNKITEEERALFRAHMKGVRRLPEVFLPLKQQRFRKSVINTQHSTSEIFTEVLTLPAVQYQEILEFCRAGLMQSFFHRLKQRQFPIADTLNLRHLTVIQARQALWDFLQYHHQQKNHCLKIIHGKGHRSPTAQPVLKNYINQWLRQYPEVLAFCSARPEDGGTGAVYVLLRVQKD
jgi:DNA-nicking Smr family endonuclease